MTVPYTHVAPSRLPNHTALLAGASHLRTAAGMLGTRSDQIRDYAHTIGPGTWVDGSSQAARSLLESLAHELSLARNALNDAASALEQAGRFVSARRPRHDQVELRLSQLTKLNLSVLKPETLAEIVRLRQERHHIERDVSAAMDHCRQVVDRCAAMAQRHHDRVRRAFMQFLKGVGDGLAAFGKGALRFGIGVWDGTWELGKGVVSLGVWAYKISPYRAMVDPKGFWRDSIGFYTSAGQFIAALKNDPGQVIREVGKSVLNLDELRRDPAHWAGMLIPGIVLAVATDGVGVAAKGLEGAEAAGAGIRAATLAGDAGAAVLRKPTLSVADLLKNPEFGVARYEGKGGFNVRQPGHILDKHVNPHADLTDRQYILLRQASREPGRRYEGLFTNEAVANDVVREFLARNENGISAWLKREELTTFEKDVIELPDSIGVASKTFKDGVEPAYQIDIVPVNQARVFLKRSNETPEGFVVQTAYPEYPKGTGN